MAAAQSSAAAPTVAPAVNPDHDASMLTSAMGKLAIKYRTLCKIVDEYMERARDSDHHSKVLDDAIEVAEKLHSAFFYNFARKDRETMKAHFGEFVMVTAIGVVICEVEGRNHDESSWFYYARSGQLFGAAADVLDGIFEMNRPDDITPLGEGKQGTVLGLKFKGQSVKAGVAFSATQNTNTAPFVQKTSFLGLNNNLDSASGPILTTAAALSQPNAPPYVLQTYYTTMFGKKRLIFMECFDSEDCPLFETIMAQAGEDAYTRRLDFLPLTNNDIDLFIESAVLEMRTLIAHLCIGMTWMAYRGICPDDVSTKNIAYSKKRRIPIIFDFGNAAPSHTSDLLPNRTFNPNCTPRYAAPEEQFPAKEFPNPSDVVKRHMFALGAVGLGVYTGAPPFTEHVKPAEEVIDPFAPTFDRPKYTVEDLMNLCLAESTITGTFRNAEKAHIQKDMATLFCGLLDHDPDRRFSPLDVLKSEFMQWAFSTTELRKGGRWDPRNFWVGFDQVLAMKTFDAREFPPGLHFFAP
ncbi:hypothetical protein M427DRAFT_38930 [Gonapodya prolifera JEL478]|uniref:Protein kinase domain-containing protein n=1 Tax=Gonapodya prolifera (strain JEL478) TaxID=1344416 RepID=A0A138ZY80_GONPJ|nr:hypothetical protein M427DRAFT_38930 [Gonapodya prolifera JEL478]|eukprot:KXS09462.1 hypothetical protein M427DRAFT_38930 [Gonapodya prolifera JEL478]